MSKLIHSSEFGTNHWGGGTTTELFIYPPTSTYKDRNFNYRISIATIEESPSQFTPLVGIARTTLILEGSIILSHEGRYQKTMNAFDQDSYQGDWNTSSQGYCKDFNLMTRNGFQGTIEIRDLARGEGFTFALMPSQVLVYVLSGIIDLSTDIAVEGDLIIDPESGENIFAKENARLVICTISS